MIKHSLFQSELLNELLHRELEAGNSIAQSGPGWGEHLVMVLLSKPFQTPAPAGESGLVYRLINDPHYWLAEIEDTNTSEMLCCRFG